MLDTKDILRKTLTQKQELVRDYQTVAQQIKEPETSEMYRDFAEAEAFHATAIKQKLSQLS